MATEVSICNHALGLLGQKRILTLLDETKEAGLCQDLYPITRDAMLGENEWTFARAQARLLAETQPPAFGYAYQFPLPPDCINVTWLGGDHYHALELDAWERVGDRVYANTYGTERSIFIWYTRRVEDAQQFPPMFADALATRLAAEMAYPITESSGRHQALWQVYQNKLITALGSEGQQGRTRRTFNRTLIRGRHGYNTGFFVVGP